MISVSVITEGGVKVVLKAVLLLLGEKLPIEEPSLTFIALHV